MERSYWIGRKRASMAMARKAATAQARLIHYELAGRYSVKAALCLPFLLVKRPPATEGERAALRPPGIPPISPGSFYQAPPEPGDKGDKGR